MAPVAVREVVAFSAEVPVSLHCDRYGRYTINSAFSLTRQPHLAINVLNTERHKSWRGHAGDKQWLVLQVCD
jgi:hypothetical protein